MSINTVNKSSWNAARKRDEMLEPYDGKLSRTVLRRESGSNPADLAGKAVSNAIKGRLIPDDDQHTLAVALLSGRSELDVCHITLLDLSDAADFFAFHSGDYGVEHFYSGGWS